MGPACASAQSDQSLLYIPFVAKDLSFLHSVSKDLDQTGQGWSESSHGKSPNPLGFFCNLSNDFDHSQQMWDKETKYETMIFIFYYSEFIQSTIALLTRGPVNAP